MVNNSSRTRFIAGLWFAAVALVVAVSMAFGAKFSTSMLLLTIGIVPMTVAMLIGFGPPAQTVAELLHATEANGEDR